MEMEMNRVGKVVAEKTKENWAKLSKTGQNYAKLGETGRNWAKLSETDENSRQKLGKTG